MLISALYLVFMCNIYSILMISQVQSTCWILVQFSQSCCPSHIHKPTSNSFCTTVTNHFNCFYPCSYYFGFLNRYGLTRVWNSWPPKGFVSTSAKLSSDLIWANLMILAAIASLTRWYAQA